MRVPPSVKTGVGPGASEGMLVFAHCSWAILCSMVSLEDTVGIYVDEKVEGAAFIVVGVIGVVVGSSVESVKGRSPRGEGVVGRDVRNDGKGVKGRPPKSGGVVGLEVVTWAPKSESIAGRVGEGPKY